MKSADKAVEVSAPGKLRVVERQVSEPGAGRVRIRVEACGICHTDAITVEGGFPGLTYPRAPGHAETNATASGNVHGLNEVDLVEAAKRGHSTAFATLSERYRKQLFRAAHRITRSCEDAEDAVQDTLLRAFVHMRDFDGRSGFGTWLTRIAINSALMILRKRRSSLEIVADCNDDFGADGLRCVITDDRPNPERRCAQSEEESMLKKAIQSLRPSLRVVVQIQQLQELSLRETADAIGISLAAAKGRMFHAKKALRKSVIPKLTDQPRSGSRTRVLPAGRWLGQGECMNTLHQSTAIQSQGKGR
jgi:RNA polymerase sigma factor (sigma-70 family)